MSFLRRSVMTGLMATSAGSTLGFRGADAMAAETVLDKALAWMGGRAAIAARPVLTWAGTATIHGGDQTIEIGVETVVDPFVYARSDSWLLSQGRASQRSLIIGPDGGQVVRNGQSAPMESGMLAHERQQYALYGLLQLINLTPLAVRPLARDPQGRDGLEVLDARAPVTLLRLDPDGRIATATNAVADPQGGRALLPQVFTFHGEISGGGVRWFQHYNLVQNHRPYFDLRLDRFEAMASRP